jgi:ribose transport system substrate-binding protein
MDIDVEWGGIPKPQGWNYPADYVKSRESGEAKAVREEYAAHNKVKFFDPSPMKKG